MKKHSVIFSVIALAAGLVACNKPVDSMELVNGNVKQTVEQGMMVVSVTPDNGSSTKAAAVGATESVIRSLQVFVFYDTDNANLGQAAGALETDSYMTFNDDADTRTKLITTTVGAKRVYAVANAPRISASTEADLKGKIIYLGNNYLTETTVGTEKRMGLVMSGAWGYTSGDAQINVVAPTGSSAITIGAYSQGNPEATTTSVPIKLYRLEARIEIQKVKVDFSETDLKGKPFVIKSIYLKNVPNGARVDGQNAGLLSESGFGYWTNKITAEAEPKDKSGLSVKSLVFDSNTYPSVGNSGAETAINRYFYTMPNPITADQTGDTFSQRRTRLVIHAEIDGVASYYPISLAKPEDHVTSDPSFTTPPTSATHSQIVGNHKYVINQITITSKGYPNDDHDEPIVTGRANVQVSVQDWNGTTVLTYGI